MPSANSINLTTFLDVVQTHTYNGTQNTMHVSAEELGKRIVSALFGAEYDYNPRIMVFCCPLQTPLHDINTQTYNVCK